MLPCGGFFGWVIFNSEQPIHASLLPHRVCPRSAGAEQQTDGARVYSVVVIIAFILFILLLSLLEPLELCGWVAPGCSPAAINSVVYKQEVPE